MGKYLISLIFAALLLAGCKKGSSTTSIPQNLSGNYTGVFATQYSGANTSYTSNITGSVTVSLASPAYSSNLAVSSVAAGTAGKYKVTDNVVAFSDSTIHPANYDWGINLNGSYSYQTKGDSLFLVKQNTNAQYVYKLKRQ